jgi:hypothetical protein
MEKLAIEQQTSIKRMADNTMMTEVDPGRIFGLGFPSRFLLKPKNRVTRRFFKTEEPVLGQLENRFFSFVF